MDWHPTFSPCNLRPPSWRSVSLIGRIVARMKNNADYDPAGKGVKMRNRESDAIGQAGIGALMWPLAVILALFVGYFIGVNQGGEQASESPPRGRDPWDGENTEKKKGRDAKPSRPQWRTSRRA